MLQTIQHSFLPQGNGVQRCEIGDGVGGSEVKLPSLYSKQQCIDTVRLQYPSANGFTFGSWGSFGSCGTKCECYAEFGMTGWDNKQTWESCMFSNIGKFNLALPHWWSSGDKYKLGLDFCSKIITRKICFYIDFQ